MPRFGRLAARAVVQYQQAVEGKDDVLLGEAADRIRAEFEARCGNPEIWDTVLKFHSELRCPFPDDSSSADPGPWLEMYWRLWLRQEGAWAYEQAKDYRGWSDTATPLGSKAREALQLDPGTSQAGSAAQRKLEAEIWGGGMPAQKRVRALESHITTALYFRPHGFSSVGCVPSDAPLGRLLLHGLYVFLATAFAKGASHHLHDRHVSYVVLQDPMISLQHYKAGLTTPKDISTFTGNLPPVAAQVPLFDHLALHWQLKLVNDVLTGVLVSSAGGDGAGERPSSAPRPPPDTPYHWSAFNKLLLLGMYAPVEEAYHAANEQHTQVPVQQLQDLADARQAEAAAAGQDMRRVLSEFRVVLHEQLQAELAVGQAALQLCAAALQEQQSNQQQPPVQLAQLKQQLQACHIADLWAQQSSNNNNRSNDSGADVDESSSRSQQLALVLCALIAWPLAVLSDTVSQSVCPPGMQPQQQSGRGAAAHDIAAAAACHQQLQQVVLAAASGLGGEQQRDAGSKPKGLQDLLLRQLGGVLSGRQQQQQQDIGHEEEEEEWQEALEEEPLSDQQLLMALLERLLGPLLQGASSGQQHPLQHAGTGTDGSTAAQHAVQGGCSSQGDATSCVTLQAVTRCVCHVLLVRLLANAPPCEAWSWDACTALLQLLVACQQAASAAGNLLYATLAASTFQSGQTEAQQQQQQERGQQDGCHEKAAQASQVELLVALRAQVAQRLLQVLHGLQQTEEALRHCSSNGSSSSSSPLVPPQQDGSSRQGRGRKVMGCVQVDASPQEEILVELNQPTFWRSQTLQLYSTSRTGGHNFLKPYFHDWKPDNYRPGFWGVVGKFAAAEQLNLRHSQDPTAFAATAPVTMPQIEDSDESCQPWLQQPVIPRVLARIANMQLLTQGMPALELVRVSDGMPVQPMALDSLLQCALLAAQQPLLLPYSTVDPTAQRTHADRDGDVLSSPSASPEPGAASRVGSARRGLVNGAAAAAAAAAARVWHKQPGFHLHSVLALGPLFGEGQQGPCLVRLMQLLMQFHAETAAAASSALQHHLAKELKQRRLWVPPLSITSSSSSGSWEGKEVPPDRSRLLVLLMGMYHLEMLEQQQDQQRRQQFKQAQQQKDWEWAQQRAGSQQMQGQQQEQDGAQAYVEDGVPMQKQRMSSRASAAAAAAAQSESPYDDMQLKRKAASSAAAAACSMHDLLLYCLSLGVEQYQAATNSSGSRFEVCTVSAALVDDGTRLASQLLHGGRSMPEDALCDVCCPCKSVQIEQLNPLLQMSQQHGVARAVVPCEDCGGHFWMCKTCAASVDVAEWHGRYCSAAGGAFADAYRGIRQTASKAVSGSVQPSSNSSDSLGSSTGSGGGSSSSSASSEPVPIACACSACSRALNQRAERASLRWRCSPLVQYSGPWAPEQQYGLLDQQQQRRPGLELIKPRTLKEPRHLRKLRDACRVWRGGMQGNGVPPGPAPHTMIMGCGLTWQMFQFVRTQQQLRMQYKAKQDAL